MGFYSPDWVRKLVKEESTYIAEYVNKKDRNQKYVNDFRGYIDSAIPFVLWLDIDEIEKRVLEPRRSDIYSIAASAYDSETDINSAYTTIYNMLYNAYLTTINEYAAKFPHIDSGELSKRLQDVSTAEVGSVRSAITSNFSRTVVVSNVTKPNKSVMLVYPRFTTVTLGVDFKNNIDYSQLGPGSEYIDTPARLIKDILQGKEGTDSFFSRLQNVGHIETDVISTVKGSRKVLRGQSSPRLLQALMALPKATSNISKTTAYAKMSRSFSKLTGQSETRLVVRKKFSGSKMVFELLIENGMSVGLPESQEDNLIKAAKERAFTIGAGFTAQIRKDSRAITEMETSKSYKRYMLDNIAKVIQTGKPSKAYSSTTTIVNKQKVVRTLPTIKMGGVSSGTKKAVRTLPTVKSVGSIANLESILRSRINEQVRQNMGSGNETRILNYRTGRFAESVSIERVSESRQGMISVFYNYMKNPYATFSDGGRQQYPKTRDPKALISKSIREIAGTMGANRLRSVVV